MTNFLKQKPYYDSFKPIKFRLPVNKAYITITTGNDDGDSDQHIQNKNNNKNTQPSFHFYSLIHSSTFHTSGTFSRSGACPDNIWHKTVPRWDVSNPRHHTHTFTL